MTGDVTILELLAWGSDTLKASNAFRTVPQNAKLDAQVLLSHLLQKNSAYLFAHGDEVVERDIVNAFHQFIARRARFEPVAYITQHKAFYGRDFFVNSHVLIPRPDTEVLVDIAKSLLTPTTTFVDIGTGSGAIAITLALETQAPTIGVDISNEAIAVAKVNAKNLHATLALVHGNLFEPIVTMTPPPSEHLVLTANLPYLTPWQWESLDPDVKDYEPKLALVGGADGLQYYDELCLTLKTYLHEMSRKGHRLLVDLLFEIDPSQAKTAPALLTSHFSQATVTLHNDLAHKARVVSARLY